VDPVLVSAVVSEDDPVSAVDPVSGVVSSVLSLLS
jgi:hypothetical protein